MKALVAKGPLEICISQAGIRNGGFTLQGFSILRPSSSGCNDVLQA